LVYSDILIIQTTGRLMRSRIAEQLLNDLEKSPQETYETVQKLHTKNTTFMTLTS